MDTEKIRRGITGKRKTLARSARAFLHIVGEPSTPRAWIKINEQVLPRTALCSSKAQVGSDTLQTREVDQKIQTVLGR